MADFAADDDLDFEDLLLDDDMYTRTVGDSSVVEYRIFADSTEGLEALREGILALACELVAEHIWHCASGFDLNVQQGGASIEAHLYGRMAYGENVEDEWLIVYLLIQATMAFEGISISVTDGDGEFLLIEAANVIPPSLTPANSQRRAWLRSGQVHLLLSGQSSDSSTSSKKQGPLTLAQGLQALRKGLGSTLAAVQQAIQLRLAEYPGKLHADRHYARCYLPYAAALLLQRLPAFIAPAVLAYCSCEPAEMSAAGALQKLRSDGTECVETRVRFTRHLYAQLSSAAVPPVTSSTAVHDWCAVDGAPHLTTTARLKAAHLGQKIALGLEILYSRSVAAATDTQNSSSKYTAAAVPASFLHTLEERGYFEGQLQGSKRYKEKLALAAQFLQLNSVAVTTATDSLVQDAAARIDAVFAAAAGQQEKQSFERVTEADDDESWMSVLPADLEAMLHLRNQEPLSFDLLQTNGNVAVEVAAGEERTGTDDAAAAAMDFDDSEAAAAQQLDDMVQGMKAFMAESYSGVEGAEVPSLGAGISFDVEKFMKLLSADADEQDAADSDADSSDDDDDADTENIERQQQQQQQQNVRVGHAHGRAVREVLDDADSDDEIADTTETAAPQQQQPQQQQQQQQRKATATPRHTQPPQPAETTPADDLEYMQQCIAAMEEQLDESAMGETFQQARYKQAAENLARAKVSGPLPTAQYDSSDDDLAKEVPGYWEEPYSKQQPPVNVDVNLVQQLLDSFTAQAGRPGPASNLLREMGLQLPTAAMDTNSNNNNNSADSDDDMAVE